MTDPNNIEVNASSIYLKTTYPPGSITHPEDSGEDARSITVNLVRRGGWSFQYIELEDDQEDTADLLERGDRNERITSDEFAALLESRPDFEYLRVGDPGVASRLAHNETHVERVSAGSVQ